MNRLNLRLMLAPLVGAVIVFTMTQAPGAAAEKVIAQFAAKALSVQDQTYAGRIDILIEHWTSDEDMRDAKDVLARAGGDALLPLLQKPRSRVGVLLMPGVQATGTRARTRRPRNLLFARETDVNGARQVVVIADQHIGLGQYERWGASSEEELTLIDLRLGADGVGVGKVAGAAEVVYNKKTGMLEAATYDKRPVRLSEVHAEKP